MDRKRVIVMGAAGRDFHDFNVVYRNDPASEVVAFTAAASQIPGIAGRSYPPELAGPLYPEGIPIVAESELEQLLAEKSVDLVVFAYSDVSHEFVMHSASRALACGADFELLGPQRTMLRSVKPVLATGATRTGAGKSQTTRYLAALLEKAGLRVVVVHQQISRRGIHALRGSGRPEGPALCHARGPGPLRDHDRGARGVRAAPRRRASDVRRSGLRGHSAPGRSRGRRRHLGRRQQRLLVLPA